MEDITLFFWLCGTAAVFTTGVQGLINQWLTPLINWALIGVSLVSVCMMLTVLIATLP